MTPPREPLTSRQRAELERLRQLRRILRGVMEAGEIMLMSDEETNNELIRLAGARGVE